MLSVSLSTCTVAAVSKTTDFERHNFSSMASLSPWRLRNFGCELFRIGVSPDANLLAVVTKAKGVDVSVSSAIVK